MFLRIKKVREQEGGSTLMMVLIFSLVIFMGQSFVLFQHIEDQKNTNLAIANEARANLVYFLGETLVQEMALRNSRYSINADLLKCLTGLPSPCDERTSYDMALYAPTPPLSFQGGVWPDAPTGAAMLAGGLTTNKLLFAATGGKCQNPNLTEPSSQCPLQAIVQFRPLCGGTANVPDFSVAGGGVCAGPATGFDVTIGVGRLIGPNFIYHQRTTSGGDAKVYRFSSLILRN